MCRLKYEENNKIKRDYESLRPQKYFHAIYFDLNIFSPFRNDSLIYSIHA